MTHAPSRGFTLIETMVAIAVLAVALVGPFIAIRNSLNASYVARDELIASSLAQEGMEYIRSIRDNNYLNDRNPGTTGWVTGLTTYSQCYGAGATGYCTVDPILGDVNTNSAAMAGYSSMGSVPYLYLTPTYIYTQQTSGNTQTRFKRGVQIRTINAHEIRVTVYVTWVTAQQSHSVTVTDTLQDWI